jgi:hypothetical protein
MPEDQSMPPELLGLLGGGPAEEELPVDEAPEEEDPVSILQQMIELAMRYQEVEEDPEDRATMAKLLATLRQYEANEQKERDQALGAGPAVKFMRRQNRNY